MSLPDDIIAKIALLANDFNAIPRPDEPAAEDEYELYKRYVAASLRVCGHYFIGTSENYERYRFSDVLDRNDTILFLRHHGKLIPELRDAGWHVEYKIELHDTRESGFTGKAYLDVYRPINVDLLHLNP